MERGMAVQVTMYLNEADEWHKRPLHLEILNYLRAENVAGATVFHAVAGFTGRSGVKTTSLVDAGGRRRRGLVFGGTERRGPPVRPSLTRSPGHRASWRGNGRSGHGAWA